MLIVYKIFLLGKNYPLGMSCTILTSYPVDKAMHNTARVDNLPLPLIISVSTTLLKFLTGQRGYKDLIFETMLPIFFFILSCHQEKPCC